ncbi:hypothetical protein B0H63DRAFT_181559 [Podospora didyma]|uniref:Fungal N-terminal domain-containing protein n=1 Tax=Podospora didyma TaxID=330526 RepID=A0AAE0NPW2_9PEZI|nr:hypothetical protein B0H63DRAFT_181559 [Podospora didyma]
MADPLTVVGTVGALTGLIGVLGKTIQTFSKFRSQWKDAELTVLTLETQLIAMRAALSKIEQWANTTNDSLHHQLVMDLDQCVACCRLLVGKLDAEISTLVAPGKTQATMSKLKLIFSSKGLQDVQKMIESQTTALTLLLTACNSNTLAEQQIVLQQTKSRKVFKKMENDIASIVVLRDIESILSCYTDCSMRSSLRSLIFDFDSELFKTRIYRMWMRGSVKSAFLKQQGLAHNECPGYDLEEKARARKIEKDIRQDLRDMSRTASFLLFGARKASTMAFLDAMKEGYRNTSIYPTKYRVRHRTRICSRLAHNARLLTQVLETLNIQPESHANIAHADFLNNPWDADSILIIGFAEAVMAL